MATHPSSIEKLKTPQTGVIFFRALELLDTFTLKLIDRFAGTTADSAEKRADSADAIRRGVYGEAVLRNFDGLRPANLPTRGFITEMLKLCDEDDRQIGQNRYGKILLGGAEGSQNQFFARLDFNRPLTEVEAVVFGSTVSAATNEKLGIREASAEDCCSLVQDLKISVSSEDRQPNL